MFLLTQVCAGAESRPVGCQLDKVQKARSGARLDTRPGEHQRRCGIVSESTGLLLPGEIQPTKGILETEVNSGGWIKDL